MTVKEEEGSPEFVFPPQGSGTPRATVGTGHGLFPPSQFPPEEAHGTSEMFPEHGRRFLRCLQRCEGVPLARTTSLPEGTCSAPRAYSFCRMLLRGSVCSKPLTGLAETYQICVTIGDNTPSVCLPLCGLPSTGSLRPLCFQKSLALLTPPQHLLLEDGGGRMSVGNTCSCFPAPFPGLSLCSVLFPSLLRLWAWDSVSHSRERCSTK